MSTLDDREKAMEKKFAMDEAMMFKAEARCCKMLGLWLAEQLGLDGGEAEVYAGTVVAANLEEPGFDDVKRAVMPDITAKGLAITEADLDQKLEVLLIEAQKQIRNEAT